jgi:DNA primase
MSDIFFEKLVDACHNLLFTDKPIYRYLLSRGISVETIKSYKLGAFPKDLRLLFQFVHPEELRKQNIIYQADKSPFKNFPLVIPIREINGNPVAIGCRTLLDDIRRDELGIPKYRNSNYPKSSYLFGLDKACSEIVKNNQAFVVEGYFDVLSAHQNGVLNVVATCGTSFSLRQLSILARYTDNVTLLFDNDGPGQLNSKRVLDKFRDINTEINLNCQFTPHGCKDLDEFLFNGGDFKYLKLGA